MPTRALLIIRVRHLQCTVFKNVGERYDNIEIGKTYFKYIYIYVMSYSIDDEKNKKNSVLQKLINNNEKKQNTTLHD